MERISKTLTLLTVIVLMTASLAAITSGENHDQGDLNPPVDEGESFLHEAQNAGANGSASFLWVEGYEPWAALVINAQDPRGVDSVTTEFSGDTLFINATDSNESNNVSILVNKEFGDEYLADSEGDIEINKSDAVNYDGLNEGNQSAGGNSVYVFHIEHFSTQSIELAADTPDDDFEPPVEDGQAFTNKANNAAANGAATFLRVEGYQPWAALVINAGDPDGVDAVTVDFDDETLTIEATDSNSTNHVTILINKRFADEHLADSEGDLDIEVSDAVNYDGMNNTNDSAGGDSVYVFQIEEFSTQTIEISEKSLPYPGLMLVFIAAAIPVTIYHIKNKEN